MTPPEVSTEDCVITRVVDDSGRALGVVSLGVVDGSGSGVVVVDSSGGGCSVVEGEGEGGGCCEGVDSSAGVEGSGAGALGVL